MARRMWEQLPRTDMTSGEVNTLLERARDAGMPIRWRWSEIYTTGGLRPSVIVTLTPAGVNEHAYDVFLDMRTDLGGWMQKTARSKLIDVDTQREWASFKVVLSLPENPTSNIAGEVDSSGARELVLFIVNDGDLYRQQHIPIIKNLITKMARGTYDPEKAVKLFMYLAESGAKKYVKEFGAGPPRGLKWHEMFNVATRREVAKSLRDSFETEAELGNYDHLLPKKYQR